MSSNPNPRVMVLEFRPELTHSIWVDFYSRTRTFKGLVKELRKGVTEGKWVGYRFMTVHDEVTGNDFRPVAELEAAITKASGAETEGGA